MKRLVWRVAIGCLSLSAMLYAALLVLPWDKVRSQATLIVVLPLYYLQFPGIVVHGPHGGYGDWRDAAIVIPVNATLGREWCCVIMKKAPYVGGAEAGGG